MRLGIRLLPPPDGPATSPNPCHCGGHFDHRAALPTLLSHKPICYNVSSRLKRLLTQHAGTFAPMLRCLRNPSAPVHPVALRSPWAFPAPTSPHPMGCKAQPQLKTSPRNNSLQTSQLHTALSMQTSKPQACNQNDPFQVDNTRPAPRTTACHSVAKVTRPNDSDWCPQ